MIVEQGSLQSCVVPGAREYGESHNWVLRSTRGQCESMIVNSYFRVTCRCLNVESKKIVFTCLNCASRRLSISFG